MHIAISLTLFLCKVFDRLLTEYLNVYAETNDLFPSLQFGYRKGLLGTYDALLTIRPTIVQCRHPYPWVYSLCNGYDIMIGLDFSADFDCEYHEALIFKFRQMGTYWWNFPQHNN